MMITLSKPISASRACTYHKAEFTNAQENYYTEGATVRGEWQGLLAAHWGLHGEVGERQFACLAEGRHPGTGEQLVRHQERHEYINECGQKFLSMEHRAGWDATISAPKSVSITALVGGDERVREAHRESARIALGEMERYVQARIGGDSHPETTGMWAVAKFEHDSSRPVDGYAAPQLHTHVFVFNLTQMADETVRPLQPRELYKTQRYATAVYRSELAVRLKSLGYEIERGEHGQPEIKGYTRQYLEASSPRRRQIELEMQQQGVSGAEAAQIAAHRAREAKQVLPREEVHAQHRKLATEHGNQPRHVVTEAARRQEVRLELEQAQRVAKDAVSYACERCMERSAVADERALLRDALTYGMGGVRLPEVQAEFEQRITSQELVEVERKQGFAGRTFTTDTMLDLEREIIGKMRSGQERYEALAANDSRWWAAALHTHLSEGQRQAVEKVLISRDRMQALDGAAGTGKTTTLAAIREAAVHEGYEVRGLAPTSRAAQKLADAGMRTETLQMHLSRSENHRGKQRRLYVLDESSLASTRQIHEFIGQLKQEDRVLFVGDVRQHEAVEAGRPYAQLQEAGMRTATLGEIVRQEDPKLRSIVEQLAQGDTERAIAQLQTQGRVHEVANHAERIEAISQEYVRHPNGTLVISPDNASRQELNQHIHRLMQRGSGVSETEYVVRVLNARQEMTAIDRRYARNYEAGDIVRYTKSSRVHGFRAGEYVRVIRTGDEENIVTVERGGGEHVSYDPRRQFGVTVYRETERSFAQGDRVQLTAPYHTLKLTNRELGTIEEIDERGNLKLKMDSGREIGFSMAEYSHLDYGYAVTSHSSLGQTADRVLIHVDSENAYGLLLNNRMAYVSISRAKYDVQIYTNDAESLGYELGRDVSHPSALSHEQIEQAGRLSANAGERIEQTHSLGIEVAL